MLPIWNRSFFCFTELPLFEEEPRSIMERLRRKEQEKERINIFIFQKHKTKYIKNA